MDDAATGPIALHAPDLLRSSHVLAVDVSLLLVFGGCLSVPACLPVRILCCCLDDESENGF